MADRADEQPEILMSIPHRIEAEWDPDFAHLAGFPLKLLYAGAREVNGAPQVASCCYWFDPGTYREDSERREMSYFPRHQAPYWVRVSCDRNGSFWETVKYRGDEVICTAQGAEFDRAMLQTTLIGLRPDEPVDPEDEAVRGLAERPADMTAPKGVDRQLPAYADLPRAGAGEKLYWHGHPLEEAAYGEYVRFVLDLATRLGESTPGAEPSTADTGKQNDRQRTPRQNDSEPTPPTDVRRLQILNGLIDYSSALEGSTIHQGLGGGQGRAGWIDPDLRQVGVGSVSREATDPRLLQEHPCHVSLRQRELSFISLERVGTARDDERGLSGAVIGPLVRLKDAHDNLYQWLDVIFAACAGKPFVYFSSYMPGARITALARQHGIRLLYLELTHIPRELREQHRRFLFLHMSPSQWEAFRRRLGEQKSAGG